MKIFSVIRKRGFLDTLDILYRQDNHEMTEYEFYITMHEDGYLNAFYRSKKDLLDCKVIGYKLSKNNKKMLYLTANGMAFVELLIQAEVLLHDRQEKI